MKIKTPQFCVGDLVTYLNDFSFNPACKVLCIGRITSVNIYTDSGFYVETDTTGQISYCVTGVGVNISEDDLTAFDTMYDLMAEINDEKTTNQLVLQAGHRYRSGDGDIVTIDGRITGDKTYPFIGYENGYAYKTNGQHHDSENFPKDDLITEVTIEEENT